MGKKGSLGALVGAILAFSAVSSGCGRDKYPQFTGQYTLESSTPAPQGLAWPHDMEVVQSSRFIGSIYSHDLQFVIPSTAPDTQAKILTFNLGIAQRIAQSPDNGEAWDGNGLNVAGTPVPGLGSCRIMRYYRLTIETQPTVREMDAAYEWTEQLRSGLVITRAHVHMNDDALNHWNDEVERLGGVRIKQHLLRHSMVIARSCNPDAPVDLTPEPDIETEAVYFSNARLGGLPPDDAIGMPSTASMFRQSNTSLNDYFLPLLQGL